MCIRNFISFSLSYKEGKQSNNTLVKCAENNLPWTSVLFHWVNECSIMLLKRNGMLKYAREVPK